MKMNCVCCNKVIESLYDTKGCWNGGVVENIHAGYGSKYDCSSFTLAICDDCLEKKVENGIVFYDKEYIFDIETDDQERWLEIKKNKLDGK